MEEIIFLVEGNHEGGFAARAMGLPIFMQGETIEEIKTNIKMPYCVTLIEKKTYPE